MAKSRPKKQKRQHNDESQENTGEIIKVHSELEKVHCKVHNNYKLSDTHNSFYGLCLQKDSKIFFVDGVAGSAKTYTAVYAALTLLQRGEIEKIFYVRSAVESASRSLGFLPGELEEKFQPWLIPLLEKMEELVDPVAQRHLLSEKVIEAAPINYWRGRTAKKQVVIVDEAQNLTYSECLTILTRIGEGCKIIFLGDSMQQDIGKASGFQSIMKKFRDEESEEHGIFTFEFTEEEIVRSEILKFIMKKVKDQSHEHERELPRS